MDTKNTEKNDGIKLFFAALALTGILLSLAMVSTVMAIQPDMPHTAISSESAYVYRPDAGDTLTMLAVGLTEQKPTDFLLIRYNPQHGQIPLILLPPQTAIGETTLAKLYEEEGFETLKLAVSRAFGIEVDRYAVVETSSFLRVASKIGTVTYEFPYEIAYATANGPIRFSAGQQRLDGQAVLALFAAPQLRSDPIEKSSLLGDIVAQGINQNISVGSDKRASGVFQLAVNLIKTDINATDFEIRRQSAAFLAEIERNYAGNITLDGITESGRFIVSEETKIQLRQYFQPLP